MGLLSWFSGPRVTAKDRAILDLKRQRDKIKQYQKRIAHVQLKEHNLAKECLAQGDKKRALLFLRKEKFQKQLLSRTDEQLASLEELVASIEFAQVQRDVVFGLEQGARVLREVNSEMSIDKVERIMDDSAEGIAYQQEVEQLLNERITRSDEEEVERELLELEQSVSGVKDATAKATQDKKTEISDKLPSAPRNKLDNGQNRVQRPQSHVEEAEEAEEEETQEPLVAN